jgi:hypothetical protein
MIGVLEDLYSEIKRLLDDVYRWDIEVRLRAARARASKEKVLKEIAVHQGEMEEILPVVTTCLKTIGAAGKNLGAEQMSEPRLIGAEIQEYVTALSRWSEHVRKKKVKPEDKDGLEIMSHLLLSQEIEAHVLNAKDPDRIIREPEREVRP